MAFSLNHPKRESKDWICIRPNIFEDAVAFFLANHCMEEMVNGCAASKRMGNRGETGPDFIAGDTYIEINVQASILNAAGDGWIQVQFLMVAAEKAVRHKSMVSGPEDGVRRLIFLTALQHGLNDRMKNFLCRELSKFGGMHMDGRTEFWIADLKLEADGITMVSYQNVTERVRLE